MRNIVITLSFISLLLFSCGPDLVVDQSNSYCNLDQSGKLVIKVKNTGNESAQASKTYVEFGNSGYYYLDTPALAKGASADLEPIRIPASCWNPDCSFKIILDFNKDVSESSESNNEVVGTCVG